MSGHRRPRLLPVLLVALVTMTGCAVTSDPTGSADPAGAGDARPPVGTVAGPAPAEAAETASSATPAPGTTTSVDRDGGYEAWLPVALDRLDERTASEPTVAREVVCEHLTVDDCWQLPEQLPAAAVRMFDGIRDSQDGVLVAPNEILRTAAVSCLLLDEMSWNDLVVLLADAADRATDLTVMAYPAIALFTPYAVVFLCPEHEAVTRQQMEAVVCDGAEPASCDQFAAGWPTA